MNQVPPHSQRQDPSLSFGSVAQAYDRGRPSYPREAASWLSAESPISVLELGAGTGKFTEQLVALGHDVHATDPDADMLARLQERFPDIRTSQSSAEEIPAGDRSYDAVVCAQAFHWFDHSRALPEIARVLKSGGRLGLVWNQRDERVPWVRRLGKMIGNQEQSVDPAKALDESGLFGELEESSFRFRQKIDRVSIKDLVLSRSNIATLSAPAQEAKLAEVLDFYDEFDRGMDGLQLPYATTCYRARVVSGPVPTTKVESDEQDEAEQAADEAAANEPSDGSDADLLLIDFR